MKSNQRLWIRLYIDTKVYRDTIDTKILRYGQIAF